MLISKAIAAFQWFEHYVVMLHAVACDDILFEQISVCFVQNGLHDWGGRAWHGKGGPCVAKRRRAWQRGRGVVHGRRACMEEGACMTRGNLPAGETTTEAGGTHPTGMHSCYFIIIIMYRINKNENNPTEY